VTQTLVWHSTSATNTVDEISIGPKFRPNTVMDAPPDAGEFVTVCSRPVSTGAS